MIFRFAEYEAVASDRQMAVLLAFFTASVASLISGVPNGISLGLVPARVFETFTNGLILALFLAFIFTGVLFFFARISNTDLHGQNPYLIYPRWVAEGFAENIATIFMIRWVFLKGGLQKIFEK
jgi:hypothetical protein